MLDYLIAVAVALVGLVVVYSLFSSIDAKETVVVKKAKASSPSPAKQKTEKKLTKKERQALKEEEEIIAKEIASATSGMHSDKRDAKIITLDEYKSTRKEKKEAREKVSGPVQTEFSPKQVEQDKEQGFSIIKREVSKKKPTSPVEPTVSQKEVLDKKLGQFFRANAKKGKSKRSFDDDAPSTEGGKVLIIGQSSGRTW